MKKYISPKVDFERLCSEDIMILGVSNDWSENDVGGKVDMGGYVYS